MTTKTSRAISVLFVALIFLGLTVKPAHAYFDPGTGSILVQALVAGFAGVGVVLKLFWQRLLAPKSARSVIAQSTDNPEDTVHHDSPNR